MDDLVGFMIWSAFALFVGGGSFIGALAEESAPVKSAKATWAAGLLFGLPFGLFTLGPLFLTGYFLALALASFVAFQFAGLEPRLGSNLAAALAGLNSGLVAFSVIWFWLVFWPFPHH